MAIPPEVARSLEAPAPRRQGASRPAGNSLALWPLGTADEVIPTHRSPARAGLSPSRRHRNSGPLAPHGSGAKTPLPQPSGPPTLALLTGRWLLVRARTRVRRRGLGIAGRRVRASTALVHEAAPDQPDSVFTSLPPRLSYSMVPLGPRDVASTPKEREHQDFSADDR
jgi:hypothetical protein